MSDLPASPRPTMAAGFIPMSIPNCPVPRRLRPFTPLAATFSPTLIFGRGLVASSLDMAANLPASPRPTLAAGVTPMSMPKCPDPRRLRPFTPVAAKCCPPLMFGHQPFGMTTLLQHDASEVSCSNMFHEHSQIHENPLLESSAAASSAADGAMQLLQRRVNKRRGLTEAVAANCPVDFGAKSTIQLRKATSAMKAMKAPIGEKPNAARALTVAKLADAAPSMKSMKATVTAAAAMKVRKATKAKLAKARPAKVMKAGKGKATAKMPVKVIHTKAARMQTMKAMKANFAAANAGGKRGPCMKA